MAELGETRALASRVRAAEPDALSVLQGSGGNIDPTGSSTINPVTLTTDHPRVTLLSMIAPSPDWFVGVSGLSLLDAQADWLSSLTVNVYPWDAGTEDGTEFSLSNPATSPQEVITSLRGMGKFSNEPIATLTFTRQSVNTAPSFTSGTGFDVDENQTAVATVAAADPDSGDGVTYEITGGADASKFDIGETTGELTFKTPPNYERAADIASTDPPNGAGNNEYVVTVTATGGTADRALTAEQTIAVSVRNVDEAGTVSFSQGGNAITAALNDPDGGVSSASWQWARSSDRNTGWTDIGGATSARYTPSSGDEEMYLRATVSYNDAQGSGKQAQGVSSSEIAPPDLQVDTLVSGLSIPWGIAFAPDGTMLFTERGGVLSSRLADGTVQTVTAEFGDLFASGETGLMGIAVDPGFTSNRRFYTCQGHTGPEIQVIAWTINAAYTQATRVADPLVGGMPTVSGRHGGCRLRFGPQGYLWIATGDAASGTVPQDLTSLGGKVLRVDASTGAGAPANPFALSRVYTYGHRNVQGLALRPGTSQMWSVEHGPSVDDEINLLVAGRNYGWNPVPGYNEGVSMTDLVKFPDALEAKWSSGSPTLATSGGIFLEGGQWGVWEGRLAVATLANRKLRLFEFTPDGAFVSQVVVAELDGVFGRLRTPMLGPDGALYVSTSNGGGTDRIIRIAEDTTPPTVSMIEITSNPGLDAAYAIGEAIEATVTFDETVVVTGRPRLSLTVGAETKPAAYDRGSDSDTLVFAYPVANGDLDTDGVNIEAGRIDLNGGTITDEAENPAELAHESVAAQAGHKVDGIRPMLAPAAGAVVDGTTLTLTYIEPLDTGSVAEPGDFTVDGGDHARTVTGVAVRGASVELTVDVAAEHEEAGIEVSYTPGMNPIRDAVGNAAFGMSNRSVTNDTPDTTAPRVMSITSEATHPAKDRFTVTIIFTEEVTGLMAGEIVVINGLGSNFAGAGATYMLDIEPSANIEDDVTVRVPADAAVDGANIGNVEGSETFAVDTRTPTVSTVEIASDPETNRTYAAGDEIQVAVTFSETVEIEGTPWLRLELGGTVRTATYRGGSGTAKLVFAYEVADGDSDTDGVSIEADSLSLNGGTITDGADNDAVLNHEAVAPQAGHKVDGVKPELATNDGAVADGATLTLTYDGPLDAGSLAEPGDFTVAGGDRARTVTRVVVRGASVELTLDVGAEHEEAGIEVSYTPGTNPIRDAVGNAAEALSRVPVTNETPDTTAPAVGSLAIGSNPGADGIYAIGDGIEVTVTFSETVEVEGTPGFRLRVGSGNRTAGYLRGTDTAALVFGYEVALGDEDTDGVSIEEGRIALNGGRIADEAGNPAELAHEALPTQTGHQVDGVRPQFLSAAVDGASLTLSYAETLDGGSRPAPGDFTVEVGSNGRTITGVSVSGSTVTLIVNPAVEHGDTGIRVSYTPGTRPVRDAVGNDAEGLSNRPVTNTTGAPNAAPAIASTGPFAVGENQAAVRRLTATDPDAGDAVTGWAITGGADALQFAVGETTGELSFREAPDYESPADVSSGDPPSAAADNEYVVTVRVTSGTGARQLDAERTFLVRVTDETERPGGARGAELFRGDGRQRAGELEGAGEHGPPNHRL